MRKHTKNMVSYRIWRCNLCDRVENISWICNCEEEEE